MTVVEAIAIKELTGNDYLAIDVDDLDEADRLSLEALKRHKSRDDLSYSELLEPLPGETEE
ncbi:hypothetical protein ES703_88184 [subsurface metagenome]